MPKRSASLIFILAFLCLAYTFCVFAQVEEVTEEEITAVPGDPPLVGDSSPGKISLDLKGVDIIELLKILSMKMNMNIVPTKDVTGRVNVFLNNVTFEDALDIILISNSLAAVREKNITTVMTLDKYTQLYGMKYKEPRKIRTLKLKHAVPKDVFTAISQLKTDVGKVIADEATGTVILMDIPEALDVMEKTVKSLDQPKETEVFELKYAKAEDIKTQLAGVLTPGSSQVELDARTNKIAVSDLPDKMKNIKKLIAEFDDETKQVLIECQIVQIDLTNKTKFGIDWERLFSVGQIKGAGVKTKFPVIPEGLPSVGDKGSQLTVGTLAANDFSLIIQALREIGKTNILSRPRIAAINGQEASIMIGTKEVVISSTTTTTANAGNTVSESISYVDIGVKLNVTPTITADNFIIMKIKPEISTLQRIEKTSAGTQVPVVDTSLAETVVKVKDSAMILIGGLMKEEVKESRGEIPILGTLPVLKWIFGNRESEKTKKELAIFLTPHIITGDLPKLDAEKEEVKTRGVLTKKIKGRLEKGSVPVDE